MAQAIDTFIARKAEIDDMLLRLTEFSEDHFGVGPDGVNWGHVGTLNNVADKLREIVAFACTSDRRARAANMMD